MQNGERSGVAEVMTAEPDLSTWPSKPEAARLLGIGERTLDRRIARSGAPEVRMRPRNNGRKPEPVCNPEDVQRLLAYEKRPVAMPPEVVRSVTLPAPVDDGAAILRVVKAVCSILGPPLEAATSSPVYLTLHQASRYSGLSMALLVRLAQRGAVEAVKDNGWKIRRKSLDQLDLTAYAGSPDFSE